MYCITFHHLLLIVYVTMMRGRAAVNLSRLLSSVGGLILDKTVTNPNFAGMAVFTPVINGREPSNLTDEALGKVGREQDG